MTESVKAFSFGGGVQSVAALVLAVEAWTAAQTEYWALIREACA